VDQSILTGETVSISKHDQAIKGDLVIQDQLNMVFSGTTVTVGKALAIVCFTGSKTAIGEIHESISETEDEKTPLKVQLDEFGDQLAKIISIICILVWVINVRHFGDEVHGGYLKGAVYYFKIAVALAVAAIPEGLAVIITTCLALGTQKMAKQGAIVRKLNSVETLGCTSVICSDKTGTLTTNQMSVRKVLVVDSGNKFFELDITGNTYGPEGQVFQNGHILKNVNVSSETVNEISKVCVLCNDAKIVVDKGDIKRIGEPTEAALLSLVEKLGSDDQNLNSRLLDLKGFEDVERLSEKDKLDRVDKVGRHYRSLFKRIHLFEFSRDRKSMSVVVEDTSTLLLM
jgi:Ca2+ transporting ATPase